MPVSEQFDGDEREGKIVLTGQDARAAARLLKMLTDAVGGLLEETAESNDAPDREELVSRARIILHSRRVRTRYFKSFMFGEAPWDMLLILYIAHSSGARNTTSRLAEVSGTPHSTAIRWIEYLEQEGLVVRNPHPTDKRKAFVQLTKTGLATMDAYLNDMGWAPLPPA